MCVRSSALSYISCQIKCSFLHFMSDQVLFLTFHVRASALSYISCQSKCSFTHFMLEQVLFLTIHVRAVHFLTFQTNSLRVNICPRWLWLVCVRVCVCACLSIKFVPCMCCQRALHSTLCLSLIDNTAVHPLLHTAWPSAELLGLPYLAGPHQSTEVAWILL